MRSALVHYWLVPPRRGGEIVLEAIASLMPGADLIGHVIDRSQMFGSLAGRDVRETFIHGLPFARKRYQAYLPLMPMALEALDMSAYDLIVSSEAGPSKWVIKDPDAYHVCYCHSPLRYIWDQRHLYMQQLPAIFRPVAHAYAGHLRQSDQLSAMRVDRFVANSNFVARRIDSYYRREATVIHPPVDVDRFEVSKNIGDYYLFAGQLRGYKAAAVAIQACNISNRKLYVVGGGGNAELRSIAGPTITFLGRVDDAEYSKLLSECRALLFPGVEDFGIVPVEVMASGRPVIGRAKGGLLDSVIDRRTGVLYSGTEVDDLIAAIDAFEADDHDISVQACVSQAERFGRKHFLDAFAAVLAER